jgi:hypothetical protein
LPKLKALFNQPIIERLDLKNAIKMGIAAAVSFYMGLHFTKWVERPDPLASGLWCVIASVVVLQAYLGGTYKAVFNRFLGVIIGSLSGAFFAHYIGTWELSLGLAITSTILLCSILNLKEGYRIASLSVAAVMIPWGVNPEISPWTFAFFRSIDTCLGLAIAVFVAYSIWPNQALQKIHSNSIQLLSLINRLYQYTYPLQAESPDKTDREKKMIQELINETNQLFIDSYNILDDVKLELLRHPNGLSIWVEFLNCLERLFNVTQAVQTIFSKSLEAIFDEELKNQVIDLMKKIESAFKELSLKLKAWQSVPAIAILVSEEYALNQQLIRFRDTHITRKYSFHVIETYFFFIYNLKSIIKELKHFNVLLDAFYSEKEADAG